MKNFVLYEGVYYSVEWYFDDRGRSSAYIHYDGQPEKEQARFLALIVRMAQHGRINDITKFSYEGDGIYAFKPQPDRYLCFFAVGKKIIIAHAFTKKSQKLSEREKDRVIRAMEDYKVRVAKGAYYE